MRLDKYLSQQLPYSRKQIKKILKDRSVLVNGQSIQDGAYHIEVGRDVVHYLGEVVQYQSFYYLMMNKPSGVVSATEDFKDKTVLELLDSSFSKAGLFPVGRLDKDTTGLLLLTNDGALAHRLTSPRHHVEKKYYATITHPLSLQAVDRFEEGIELTDFKTKPAKLELVSDHEVFVTLTEGKYHQVKRMIKACGSEVVTLKRIQFGSLQLDPNLTEGMSRLLSEEEIDSLTKK